MNESASWKFIPTDVVPQRKRGFYSQIINDFLTSNLEVAKLDYKFNTKIVSTRYSLMKAGQGKVRVFVRNNEIFLLRLKNNPKKEG